MKNQFNLVGVLMTLLFALSSCGGGGYTYQWAQPKYEKETYDNIMVMGITKDLGSRQRFESGMVGALSAQGVKATSSLNWFNSNNVDANMSADALEKLLKEKGFDGVITAAAIDKDKETDYVQGATYSAYPGYYGRGFRGYYGAYGGMIQEPGYYTTTNVFVLQFNFYQLNNPGTDAYNALVWTVQDKVDEPSNPEKFTSKYCEKLVESMKADGII